MSYIWDTNIAIYYLNGGLNSKAEAFIDAIPESSTPYLSIIAEIELLGWPRITPEEALRIKAFIADVTVLPVSEAVKEQTILIKQQRRIKLPDALIAASAMVHDLTLLSRNESDFKNIAGLKFVNPFA